MKVAVYTIALNEEQFVERWYNSAKDADYLLIADTGSSDRTVELAESFGINVVNISVNPWRFDVARNKALGALPDDIDYCISLDLDEVLEGDWRGELEKAYEVGSTRPRYNYTWSFNPDGTKGLTFAGDKIHARHGYYWKHPVHEVITTDKEEYHYYTELELHHHPDPTKSRAQYLPLLELSIQENPNDDRNAHYLAREYYFHGRYEEAAREFKRHLSLPTATWRAERSASMNMLAECEPQDKEHWLLRSCAEAPERRESWVAVAQYYLDNNRWVPALTSAMRALEITERPMEYLNQPEAWGWKPHDVAAVASYYLGMREQAIKHGNDALQFAPDDQRLLKNMEWYLS
jgi:tetratricopeptide (TPR) repeat protein